MRFNKGIILSGLALLQVCTLVLPRAPDLRYQWAGTRQRGPAAVGHRWWAVHSLRLSVPLPLFWWHRLSSLCVAGRDAPLTCHLWKRTVVCRRAVSARDQPNRRHRPSSLCPLILKTADRDEPKRNPSLPAPVLECAGGRARGPAPTDLLDADSMDRRGRPRACPIAPMPARFRLLSLPDSPLRGPSAVSASSAVHDHCGRGFRAPRPVTADQLKPTKMRFRVLGVSSWICLVAPTAQAALRGGGWLGRPGTTEAKAPAAGDGDAGQRPVPPGPPSVVLAGPACGAGHPPRSKPERQPPESRTAALACFPGSRRATSLRP